MYVQKQPKPYKIGQNKIDQSFIKYERMFFRSAILKLIKEDYIYLGKNANIEMISPLFIAGVVDITFDGIIFIINGGYHAQQRKLERENNNFQELQARQDVLANQTFLLTVVIAVGTSIARDLLLSLHS